MPQRHLHHQKAHRSMVVTQKKATMLGVPYTAQTAWPAGKSPLPRKCCFYHLWEGPYESLNFLNSVSYISFGSHKPLSSLQKGVLPIFYITPGERDAHWEAGQVHKPLDPVGQSVCPGDMEEPVQGPGNMAWSLQVVALEPMPFWTSLTYQVSNICRHREQRSQLAL